MPQNRIRLPGSGEPDRVTLHSERLASQKLGGESERIDAPMVNGLHD
jgi:hypothetical protein